MHICFIVSSEFLSFYEQCFSIVTDNMACNMFIANQPINESMNMFCVTRWLEKKTIIQKNDDGVKRNLQPTTIKIHVLSVAGEFTLHLCGDIFK